MIRCLRSVLGGAYHVIYGSIPTPASNAIYDPKRILLINGFHVGDIVIATSVLPVLRAAYPKAEIGFATGSWSHMVVRDHPDVRYAHCIDHWMLNRSAANFIGKVIQYRKTRRVALNEIRTLKYDIAISLFTNFPDFLNLSYAARIPVRVGFRRSIFSRLATHLVDEPESPFVTQGARLSETLRALPIATEAYRLRQSTLAPSGVSAIREVCSLLKVDRIEVARYQIIHMGSGAACRELPPVFWRELAKGLSVGSTVLFTGRGERERGRVQIAIQGLQNCVNACDRLSWSGFVAAVRHADILYGVESMAGHVAGAVGTKCIVVYSGTAGVGRWRPEGANSIVMTNHVPCAPCLRGSGCAAMTCLQGVRAGDLVELDKKRRQP